MQLILEAINRAAEREMPACLLGPEDDSLNVSLRDARDLFLNHIMSRRGCCHSPSDRYCPTGDRLRRIYEHVSHRERGAPEPAVEAKRQQLLSHPSLRHPLVRLALEEGVHGDRPLARRIASIFKKKQRTATRQELLDWAARRYHVVPDGTSLKTQVNRLLCWRWWKRTIGKTRRRGIEQAWLAIEPKTVHYCSPDALSEQRRIEWAAEDWAAAHKLVNKRTGETARLPEPEQKRARARREQLRRIEALITLADDKGLEPGFITITPPGWMHNLATARSGKGQNLSHDGWTVEDTHQWHMQRFNGAMRELTRRGIGKEQREYIRVAQPHRDGTPHYHLCLWCDPKHLPEVEEVFRYFFEAERKHGEKRYQHGVKIEPLKSADDLVCAIKYAMRGVTGRGTEESERIQAWARTHGIRRFSTSIGGSTLIQELQRLEEEEVPSDLMTIVRAARSGQYALVLRERDRLGMRLVYEDKTNRYGDRVKRLAGLHTRDGKIIPRTTRWEIVPVDPKAPRGVISEELPRFFDAIENLQEQPEQGAAAAIASPPSCRSDRSREPCRMRSASSQAPFDDWFLAPSGIGGKYAVVLLSGRQLALEHWEDMAAQFRTP